MADPAAVEPGRVQTACGKAALEAIELAARGCLAGRFAGIATCPIHKQAIHQAGSPHPGHTEMIASLCRCRRFAMMLYSERIAVSFLTLHVPLSQVRGQLSVGRTVEVIELTADTLRRIRGREPRVAVLALNPHAGEEGLFGHAEAEVLVPAVEQARGRGLDVTGPLPADTAFTPAALDRYDGHVTCYHDQGGIPFKMLAFEDGVNFTMGLPICRTSVDHGTAFDIAWQGRASAASLLAAIRLARRLATTV
jgi:4-hydroxythreonine-4-phosphate dehydrogenase